MKNRKHKSRPQVDGFYFVELRKGKEKKIGYLANSLRQAKVYADASNFFEGEDGWKAVARRLSNRALLAIGGQA